MAPAGWRTPWCRVGNAILRPGPAAGYAPCVLGLLMLLCSLLLVIGIIMSEAAETRHRTLTLLVPADPPGQQVQGLSQSSRISAALTLLRETPGTVSLRRLTAEQVSQLPLPARDLPWPAPAAFEVRVGPEGLPENRMLRARLEIVSPGIKLLEGVGSTGPDLLPAGRTTFFGLVLLVLASMVVMIVLMVRSVLAVQSDTVALLFMMGATDRFVVRQLGMRMLRMTAPASIAGAVSGAAGAAGLLEFWGVDSGPVGLQWFALVVPPLFVFLVSWLVTEIAGSRLMREGLKW